MAPEERRVRSLSRCTKHAYMQTCSQPGSKRGRLPCQACLEPPESVKKSGVSCRSCAVSVVTPTAPNLPSDLGRTHKTTVGPVMGCMFTV